MKRSGERQMFLQTKLSGRHSQRPFSKNMDMVGREMLQQLPDFRITLNRQPDRRVTGARDGIELLRRYHQHIRAIFAECPAGVVNGGHHTIDLWLPGIGNECDFQSHLIRKVLRSLKDRE